jgi:hypothetical protein
MAMIKVHHLTGHDLIQGGVRRRWSAPGSRVNLLACVREDYRPHGPLTVVVRDKVATPHRHTART